MQERELSGEDVVVMFLDRKMFPDATMVVALGITLSGEKRFLGFVETDTENERVLAAPALAARPGTGYLPRVQGGACRHRATPL